MSSVATETLGFDRLAERYLSEHLYRSALYWADKQYSVSGPGGVKHVERLARCLLLTGQPRRAAELLQSSGHHRQQPECCLLTAQALLDTGESEAALALLQGFDAARLEREVAARVQLVSGRVHQAMDDRARAVECLWRALHLDVTCHEALDQLLGDQLLTEQQEQQLLESLPFEEQLTAETAAAVRALYRLQLKKYTAPESESDGEMPEQLVANGDVLSCRAEQLYYSGRYDVCACVCERVLSRDADHPACLPVLVACEVQAGGGSRLFQLAHRLVDRYPESALAWYSVAAYYYCTGRMETARRYLSKASAVSAVFGPARLLYAHCFADENEHDQAISAYLSAAQLMRGCHLPLLYVGREYALTNNSRLAGQFFEQARLRAPRDPHVLHEMGVAAFCGRDFATAERRFSEALALVEGGDSGENTCEPADTATATWPALVPPDWEPLYNNLAHTYRKLGQFERACSLHQRALLLRPRVASTFSALAFTHALAGNHSSAVQFFHKALSLRRDDAFSTQMLASVLQLLMNSSGVGVQTVGAGEQFLFGTEEDLKVGVVSAPACDKLDSPATVDKSALDSCNDMSMDFDSDRG